MQTIWPSECRLPFRNSQPVSDDKGLQPSLLVLPRIGLTRYFIIFNLLMLDETKIESLGGMINCKIMDGHLEDAIH